MEAEMWARCWSISHEKCLSDRYTNTQNKNMYPIFGKIFMVKFTIYGYGFTSEGFRLKGLSGVSPCAGNCCKNWPRFEGQFWLEGRRSRHQGFVLWPQFGSEFRSIIFLPNCWQVKHRDKGSLKIVV